MGDMDLFSLDGKAIAPVELSDGDLIIEGLCAVFAGEDRTQENFASGSLAKACKAFLAGSASLCYHHKTEKLLGRVLSLEEIPNLGVRLRARVDGAIRTHPELKVIYEQIRSGSLSGLSIGGYFRRAMTKLGQRIVDLDITEISCTPVPCHAGTGFELVSGKSLELALVEFDRKNLEWLRDQLQARDAELADLTYTVDKLQLGIRR
jgi:HK97 family phage prohead protease